MFFQSEFLWLTSQFRTHGKWLLKTMPSLTKSKVRLLTSQGQGPCTLDLLLHLQCVVMHLRWSMPFNKDLMIQRGDYHISFYSFQSTSHVKSIRVLTQFLLDPLISLSCLKGLRTWTWPFLLFPLCCPINVSKGQEGRLGDQELGENKTARKTAGVHPPSRRNP